jgi:uncharacterized protein (DUF488 family)
VEIYTIGFTRKSAGQFFELLKRNGIRRLVDVRLNNISQLAGFSKRDDLQYFLREILDAEYLHEPLLAPTQDMLDDLKKRHGSWVEYERRFLQLMRERRIEQKFDRLFFRERTVLLCSEPTAEHCHRRLVVDYLSVHWGDVGAVHL